MKNIKLLLLSIAILFSSQIFAMKKLNQKYLNGRLIQAIQNKNLNQVKAAIKAGADVNGEDNNYGSTALMWAACKQLEIVEYLIQAGADVNIKGYDGSTVLMSAAASQPEVVKYLIDYCKSNNIKLDVNIKGYDDWTALIFAAKHQPKAVKYLIDYCQSNNIKLDVNAKENKYRMTALMYAVRDGKPEAVKYLIQAGADPNAKEKYGSTALMIAAFKQPKIVEYLIQSGAHVNTKDCEGMVALMYAAKYGKSEAAKYLVQAGSDVNAKDNYGRTALVRAAKYGKSEVVKYLASVGSDLNKIKNKYPAEYKNALEGIKKWIFTNYPKDRNKVLSKIKFIALSRALKLIRDSNGNTLLHYAAIKEDIQLFGLIYSICPSLIATTNNKNQTPVQIALGNPKFFALIKKLALQKDKPEAQPCNLF